MLPENLLYPLKFNVIDFKEEEHDYHFRVELPEPTCCQACGALESRIVKFGKDDQACGGRSGVDAPGRPLIPYLGHKFGSFIAS